MKLRNWLRLGDSPLVTLTGAGGKSTLLFTLACEYPAAFVTATTHLGAWQIPWAARTIYVKDAQDLRPLEDDPLPGVTLLLGEAPQNERARGVSLKTLKLILALSARRNRPLLVEADGARRRALKAPAAHEPHLPIHGLEGLPHTHLTLAGLSALGKQLDERHVHRPEIFARLSGLAPGEPLTVEALAALLTHPRGGLKGIPKTARRVAVLTQAVTPAQQAAGQRLAAQLLSAYHAVLLLETHPAPQGVLSAPRPLAVWEPVGAVILAAGEGQRMGQPKALLPWRGQPFVRHVAQTALQAGLWPVIVVEGAQPLKDALHGLEVRLVHNPDWAQGQGTSVSSGASALPPECGAALFLQVDQPHIPVTVLRALRNEHARTLAPIIAPFVDNRRATPVLFDRSTFPDLRALHGTRGGRALFSRYRLHYLPWHDRSLLWDIDTPDDYHRLLESTPE